MQSDVVKHKWERIREQTKQWWAELTDEDLMDVDGDRDKLIALIRRKYGYSQEEAAEELERRLSEYERFVR